MHLRLLLKMMMKMPYVILGPPISQLSPLRLQNLTKNAKILPTSLYAYQERDNHEIILSQQETKESCFLDGNLLVFSSCVLLF